MHLWCWWCFALILVCNSPAGGERCSGLWHICRDAPWLEETPRQSKWLWRSRLFTFLFFHLVFVVNSSRLCTLCPRILPVLQHPWAQAGMLLLQWCCCTRRRKENTQLPSKDTGEIFSRKQNVFKTNQRGSNIYLYTKHIVNCINMEFYTQFSSCSYFYGV